MVLLDKHVLGLSYESDRLLRITVAVFVIKVNDAEMFCNRGISGPAPPVEEIWFGA